jgi:hypothetical protein
MDRDSSPNSTRHASQVTFDPRLRPHDGATMQSQYVAGTPCVRAPSHWQPGPTAPGSFQGYSGHLAHLEVDCTSCDSGTQ